MKYFSFLFLSLLLVGISKAQNVGIGTSTPDAAAILDVQSSTKGLLIPRLTTAQRDAIVNPGIGLLIFNLTDSEFNVFNGLQWTSQIGTDYTRWSMTGNANTNPLNHFIGTTDATDFVIRTNGLDGLRLKSLSPVTSAQVNPFDVLLLTIPGTINDKWPLSASFRLGSYQSNIQAKTQMDIVLGDNATPLPDTRVMSLYGNGDVNIAGTGSFGQYLKIGTNVAEGYFQNAADGAYRALNLSNTNQGYWFQNYNGVNTTMYVGLAGAYAGRVGIGTVTPVNALSVAGSVDVSSLAGNGNKPVFADANGKLYQGSNATGNIGCVVRTQYWNATVVGSNGLNVTGFAGSADVTEVGAFGDTRLYNTGAYQSNTSNAYLRNHFTAPVEGFYLVTLHVIAASSNSRLLFGASLNDAPPVEIWDEYIPANCTSCTDITYSKTIYLQAGDTHRILRSTSGQGINEMFISYKKL